MITFIEMTYFSPIHRIGFPITVFLKRKKKQINILQPFLNHVNICIKQPHICNMGYIFWKNCLHAAGRNPIDMEANVFFPIDSQVTEDGNPFRRRDWSGLLADLHLIWFNPTLMCLQILKVNESNSSCSIISLHLASHQALLLCTGSLLNLTLGSI